MKKIAYLFMAVLSSTCFMNCSSDDDTPIITDHFTNEKTADGLSEATAYEIDNAYQLKLLALRVNNDSVNAAGVAYDTCYYKVTKDIDMSSVCSLAQGSWIVIGTGGNVMAEETYFGGHFDGGNHTISNLYINESETNCCQMGLFGSIMNATVKNLKVSGSITIGKFSQTPVDNMHFGGIVALASNSLVQNCSSSVDMDITASIDTEGKFWRVGGVIGLQWQTSKASIVDRCSYSGKINVTNKLTETKIILTVGGVCGGASTSKNSIIQNCYNTGTIQEKNDGGVSLTYVGGLLGSSSIANNNNLYNCYNTGTVTKETEGGVTSGVGGIVGYVAAGNTIANVYTSTDNVCGYLAGSATENCFSQTTTYTEASALLNLWATAQGESYNLWDIIGNLPSFID